MKTYFNLGWLALVAAAAYAMFHVGFQVERLESNIAALNEKSAAEREALHVLRAEWSYLNRPGRLAKLSEQLLPHLQPPRTGQLRRLEELPETAEPVAAAVAQR